MSNELIVIEPTTALQVLSSKSGTDKLIEDIRARVMSLEGGNMKTASGRKKIRSNAFQATKAKTFLNEQVDKQISIVESGIANELATISGLKASKKNLEDGLKAVRKEVNEEVDAYEAEIKRIEDEKQFNIDLIEAHEINAQFDENRKLEIENDHEVGLLMNEKHDRDIADKMAAELELERQRIEQEKKDRAIREAKIAQDAKEKAEREALGRENQIKIDALAAEERAKAAEAAKVAAQDLAIAQAKQSEIDKAEEAKRQAQIAKDAEQKRLDDVEAAKQDEIQRQEMEKKQAELDRLKNEANKKHAAKIHNEMMQDAIAGGVDPAQAKAFVILLAKNEIRHISKVQY